MARPTVPVYAPTNLTCTKCGYDLLTHIDPANQGWITIGCKEADCPYKDKKFKRPTVELEEVY